MQQQAEPQLMPFKQLFHKREHMKKKMITHFLLLSIFSLSIMGNEDFCKEQAFKYGNAQGHDKVSHSCYDFDLNKALPTAIDENDNIKVMAHSNRVYVTNKLNNKKDFITGIYTNLENSIAVTIIKDRNEVAVLQKSGDILIFSSIITGNVAPYRTISVKELHGSSDIAYKNSEIVVLNNENKTIFHFNILANSNGREGHKKLDPIRTNSIIDKKYVSIEVIDGHLYGVSSNDEKEKVQ